MEYNGPGRSTADYLMRELEYPNLYRPMATDRVKSAMLPYMHWYTTSKTKPLLKAKMNETLLEDGIIIRSQYLLDELRGCEVDGESFEAGGDNHDDAAMAACIALYCLRQTMPELRIQATSGDGHNQTPDRGARPTGGSVVYGLYDSMFRLRSQTLDLSKAQDFVAKNPGYQIKPIQVSKANTAFSVVHHGDGIENELYRQQGVDSWSITPSLVGEYAAATGRMTQHGQMPQRPAGVPLPGAQLGAEAPASDEQFWGEMSGGLGPTSEL